MQHSEPIWSNVFPWPSSLHPIHLFPKYRHSSASCGIPWILSMGPPTPPPPCLPWVRFRSSSNIHPLPFWLWEIINGRLAIGPDQVMDGTVSWLPQSCTRAVFVSPHSSSFSTSVPLREHEGLKSKPWLHFEALRSEIHRKKPLALYFIWYTLERLHLFIGWSSWIHLMALGAQ